MVKKTTAVPYYDLLHNNACLNICMYMYIYMHMNFAVCSYQAV